MIVDGLCRAVAAGRGGMAGPLIVLVWNRWQRMWRLMGSWRRGCERGRGCSGDGAAGACIAFEAGGVPVFAGVRLAGGEGAGLREFRHAVGISAGRSGDAGVDRGGAGDGAGAAAAVPDVGGAVRAVPKRSRRLWCRLSRRLRLRWAGCPTGRCRRIHRRRCGRWRRALARVRLEHRSLLCGRGSIRPDRAAPACLGFAYPKAPPLAGSGRRPGLT